MKFKYIYYICLRHINYFFYPANKNFEFQNILQKKINKHIISTTLIIIIKKNHEMEDLKEYQRKHFFILMGYEKCDTLTNKNKRILRITITLCQLFKMLK